MNASAPAWMLPSILLGEEIKSGRISPDDRFPAARLSLPAPEICLSLLIGPPAMPSRAGPPTKAVTSFIFSSEIKSRALTLSALMLIVSNGPYFGMNFAVAPQERMDDGLFTVSVFSRYSKLQLWWHFASMAFGRREYSPKSIAFRVAKLKVGWPKKTAGSS